MSCQEACELQLSFRDTEHPQGWSLYRAFALVLLLSWAATAQDFKRFKAPDCRSMADHG